MSRGMTEQNGPDVPGLPAVCRRTREALSEYIEDSLSSSARQIVAEHMDGCEGCSQQERELAALLHLVHERIPRREPSLDLWAELAPKVEAWRAEEKLSLVERLRVRTGRLYGNIAAGAILFTHALAVNTEIAMRKHLMTDPFRLMDEA